MKKYLVKFVDGSEQQVEAPAFAWSSLFVSFGEAASPMAQQLTNVVFACPVDRVVWIKELK